MWFHQVLTGPDNRTVAIGRVIGVVLAMALLLVVPLVAVATTACGITAAATWSTLLAALALYVPGVTIAITGMIWGTNPTEPKPQDPSSLADKAN